MLQNNKIEKELEKLKSTYRYIMHIYHLSITASDLRKILFSLDKYQLNMFIRPYTWIDYIIIDDEFISTIPSTHVVPFSEKEWDEFSDFDLESIYGVISSNWKDNGEVESVDHLSLLDHTNSGIEEMKKYYYVVKENTFFMDKPSSEYHKMIRDRKIKKILCI